MPIIKLKSENDALQILNTNLKEKIASLEMQISCFRDFTSDTDPRNILILNLKENLEDLENQLFLLQSSSIQLIETLRVATLDNKKLQDRNLRMVENFKKLEFFQSSEKKLGSDEQF